MKSNYIAATGTTSGIGEYWLRNTPNPVYEIYRNQNILFEKDSMAFPKFNGFVHFAGEAETKPINLFNRESFERLMWSNVGLAMEIIKHISKNKYSENLSIVLISSVAALRGDSCLSTYSATKGALISLTKSLAVELAPKGIRVNCISPGHIKDTKMSRQGSEVVGEDGFKKIVDRHLFGLGEKEDVFNMVEYLLSDKSKWITGQNFVIDGGYTA